MARSRRARLATVLLCGTAAAVAPAAAQNATNEAWIGQTGETNVITIIQAGIGNSAGANASTNLINQDGRFNTIAIDQFGWQNKAGASDRARPPEGINQTGDQNVVEIGQSNGSSGGWNVIGAVWQDSPGDVDAGNANRLIVRQSATDAVGGDVLGDGGANHAIGSLVQRNIGGGMENLIKVLQIGGLAGIGNTLQRIYQEGTGNLAEVEQFESGNQIGVVRQFAGRNATRGGDYNSAYVIQHKGSGNTIESVTQIGDSNNARVEQAGVQNYVASVYQNNEGVAISGNTIVATFAGDDNGGDGLGGLGAFASDVARAVGVFQGEFAQFGDDNTIRFTVNGGDGNLFGVRQSGDGHGAVIAIGRTTGAGAIKGSENEVAVVQFGGDDNSLSLTIVGNGNVDGIVMEGSRNTLALEQTGNDNAIDVVIDGNNNNNAALVGGFAASVASIGLLPGQGLQSGDLNNAFVRIGGNGNLTAFSQAGDRNEVSIRVTGASNQSAVSQAADSNVALIKQNGTGNAMTVRQF